MKAIDYELRGNSARIFLGKDDLVGWWGDDWDDVPYEHNAGRVSDEFVAGHIDVAFPFDAIVLEPCDGTINSRWSKQDMQRLEVPMFAVLPNPPEEGRGEYEDDFLALMGCLRLGVWSCYMGQEIHPETSFPDGTIVMQVVMKDDMEYIDGLRQSVVGHLRWAQRSKYGDADYSDILSHALLGVAPNESVTCSDITKRIILLVDREGNEEVVERLRHIVGAPSFVYPHELCRALFGETDPECPLRDTSEITARLIELIGAGE